MAYIVMTYIVMAYVVMAYIVMANIVMAYIVAVDPSVRLCLYTYGLYSYGPMWSWRYVTPGSMPAIEKKNQSVLTRGPSSDCAP